MRKIKVLIIGIFLLFNMISLGNLFDAFANSSSVEQANDGYQQGWPVQTVWEIMGSPVLIDLDGDKKLEVIIGSDPYLYIWSYDGTNFPGWPQKFGHFAFDSSPAVGDIDGDGDYEIVAAANDLNSFDTIVCAWNHNGEILDNWPKIVEGEVTSSPVLSDLDDDGKLDILLHPRDSTLYAWNYKGENIQGWPCDIIGGVNGYQPSVGDIDKDGKPEIVLPAFFISETWGAEQRVYAFNHDGTDVDSFPVLLGDRDIQSHISLGDINADGYLELVFGAANWLYSLNHDGTITNHFPVLAGDWQIGCTPSLGDIDNDGFLEIFAGAGGGKIYGWYCDGTRIDGWPVSFSDNFHATPIIGDIDLDGKMEIIAGTSTTYPHGDGNELYVLNHDGTKHKHLDLRVYGRIYSTAALNDIDRDGDVEIAVGAGDGKMYIWDLPGLYRPKTMEWPMFQHDPYHSGNYEIEFEDEINPSEKRMTRNRLFIKSNVIQWLDNFLEKWEFPFLRTILKLTR